MHLRQVGKLFYVVRETSAFSKTQEARKYSQWAVDRFFNYARGPTVIAQKSYCLRDHKCIARKIYFSAVGSIYEFGAVT